MNKIIIAAVALLLLTNLIVLSGVAYNRSNEPLSSIDLTERELGFSERYAGSDENSGTALQLNWQVLDSENEPDMPYARGVTPAWLNDTKLTALGFDLNAINRHSQNVRYDPALHTMDVFLVLEYDGAAYRQALQRAEQNVAQLRENANRHSGDRRHIEELAEYKKHLKRLRISQSRLYVVDAGLDLQALREKVLGHNNYLLARGEINLGREGELIRGHIGQLYIQEIHVPLPYAQQLEQITQGKPYSVYGKNPVPPRYTIRLNTGKRLEPWIESVASLTTQR